jgi:hypothetical protein
MNFGRFRKKCAAQADKVAIPLAHFFAKISTFPDLGNSSMFLRNIIDSHFPPCYTQLEAARERLPAQKTAHEG